MYLGPKTVLSAESSCSILDLSLDCADSPKEDTVSRFDGETLVDWILTRWWIASLQIHHSKVMGQTLPLRRGFPTSCKLPACHKAFLYIVQWVTQELKIQTTGSDIVPISLTKSVWTCRCRIVRAIGEWKRGARNCRLTGSYIVVGCNAIDFLFQRWSATLQFSKGAQLQKWLGDALICHARRCSCRYYPVRLIYSWCVKLNLTTLFSQT